MILQTRPATSGSQGTERASKPVSSRRDAIRIEGSEFVDYLSKAERKFIIDKFADSEHASDRKVARFGEKTRGIYLDLKA